MHPEIVSERLGHATVGITLERGGSTGQRDGCRGVLEAMSLPRLLGGHAD